MAGTSTQAQRQATASVADARQIVGFSFYRVDPAWRRLPRATKQAHGKELLNMIEGYATRLMLLTYSLAGLKADVDFLIWCVGNHLEDLQELSGAIRHTKLGGYLATPYAYVSMTKRSTYVDRLDPAHQDARRFIAPAKRKYLFVYPFVKTSEWYQLPLPERQAMMDEHIRVGNRYPSVRIHTTYSFGLDDQEFMLAFEADSPKDFLDLVMELRESKTRPYTLRDTPIFACVAKPLREILKDVGG